jgi:hypothetical protein
LPGCDSRRGGGEAAAEYISFQDKNVDAMSGEEEIHMVFAMRRYK